MSEWEGDGREVGGMDASNRWDRVVNEVEQDEADKAFRQLIGFDWTRCTSQERKAKVCAQTVNSRCKRHRMITVGSHAMWS